MSNTLQIGPTILRLRHARGITQEELARYLGVSKPAVSKWESGATYPDITLLPFIASYFGVSMDELLAYQPQLDAGQIRKLYNDIAAQLVQQGYEAAYDHIREATRQYHSCWTLLFHMATLLLNHIQFAPPQERDARYGEILQWLTRVEENSPDKALALQARHVRATVYIMQERPSLAIDLLEDTATPSTSPEHLLSLAYAAKGDTARATSILQASMFQNIAEILSAYPNMLAYTADDPDKTRRWLKSAQTFNEAFDIETLHPALMISVYLQGALFHAREGDYDSALDYLEDYVRVLCTPGVLPFRLRGNALFDSLSAFIDSLALQDSAPRNDETILEGLKTTVATHPAFEPLRDTPRYRALAQCLEHV